MKQWSDITLLIVDDEVDLAELVAFEFEMEGADVSLASNGEEAISLLESDKKFDVVISDIRMPKMDGVQLLEEVKKRSIHTPHVVLMTDFSDITIDQAYAKGASAVFPKPFDRKELSAAVQACTQDISTRWIQEAAEG